MSLKTPLTQARFLPGTMVGDRWRIVSPLGQGGMGEVYRADDLKLGEVVALKFLPERLEHDASLRERFLSEARLARQVAHPNVCRMYDIGEILLAVRSAPRPYAVVRPLVARLLRGQPFSSRLRPSKRRQDPRGSWLW